MPLWKQAFDLFPFQTRNPNWESEYGFLYHPAFFWQSYNHIHFSPSPLGEGSNESYNQLASQAGMGVVNEKPKSKFLKQEVWKQAFNGITRFARDPWWRPLQTLKPTLRVIFICSSAFMKASFQQSPLQIKTPAGAGVGLRVCGERGIRTPGTVFGTPV